MSDRNVQTATNEDPWEILNIQSRHDRNVMEDTVEVRAVCRNGESFTLKESYDYLMGPNIQKITMTQKIHELVKEAKAKASQVTITNILTEEQLTSVLKSQTAPKVHEDKLEELIVKEAYHHFPGTTVTVCMLTLKNGFTVTGESACADAANFDAAVGKTYARRKAKDKIWELEGYTLRNKLALIEKATPPTMPDSDVKTYVGTKVVHACPMSRGAYNKLRGWETPADEDPDEAGYLVEYADGGKPNLQHFRGYVSWSPKDVFEGSYDTGVVLKETTHNERMLAEMDELTQRTEKLRVFLSTATFASLVPREQHDLKQQLNYMENYAWHLGNRIRRAAGEGN